MSKPTVSVVIPCYNGAKFLRETLDSVLAQTYPVLEVLVIDDGSTDDSAAIAESYGPPIRVIRQPNQGESVARNRGIDEAKGDWIAFLDADDLWLPTKIESQLMTAVPQLYVGVCTASIIRDQRDNLSKDAIWNITQDDICTRYVITNGMPFHIATLIVRSKSKARFPSWTRSGEDMVYLLDLLKEGDISIVNLPLVIYRKHANAQSVSHKYIGINWYDTLTTWINMQRGIVGDDVLNAYKLHAAVFLAKCGKSLLKSCDYCGFENICDRLISFKDSKEVKSLLRLRKYPRWLARLA